MRNFLMLFEEKEGTSAVVTLLDNFQHVAVVHQDGGGGWEPFDNHNCGQLPVPELRRCLELIYGPDPVDMTALNAIYRRRATAPLATIPPDHAVGFKMRLRPPADLRRALRLLPGPIQARLRRRYVAWQAENGPFHSMLFDVLREQRVLVLVAVRQDVLRWALSKYHGDGTGRPGHIQFALSSGQIDRSSIPSLTVDPDRLDQLIAGCEASHRKKRALIDDLRAHGIDAVPVLYERFLTSPAPFFEELLGHLEVPTTPEAVSRALEAGTTLERVHDDDISSFVTNHEEVIERFGDRYVSWERAS